MKSNRRTRTIAFKKAEINYHNRYNKFGQLKTRVGTSKMLKTMMVLTGASIMASEPQNAREMRVMGSSAKK